MRLGLQIMSQYVEAGEEFVPRRGAAFLHLLSMNV